ncbi:oxytocin-neurophysin 1-like [Oppia nitens]|uniref:oxytocin-neurophysin 1-like n=1 Tax=Oppia nitens TaxID=1686743 RepID=UPI0023DAB8F6|nr:oxytocin-neurophysin 1-like [Oppia nitens]XP_054159471.1 oxytocin-neurophysin 1-like [Oppia nitens]XP_054161200.1 oxytocin-neurophysin 1-like [Oppia nitens]
MNLQKILTIVSLFIVSLAITYACFITNCPPGGKRSLAPESPKRQCTRCGPSGVGRCFGPSICCGASIGCHINNKYTAVCFTEDYTPRPCFNEGKVCANGKGICALDSTCCTSVGCFMDKSCQTNQIKGSTEERIWSNYGD